MKNRIVHLGIIGIFCSLYFLVATISMINSVAFFDLAHTGLMNWALAIGFELGAAASLAAIIILDKTNKAMVWSLFLLLTAFQMMANSYHAFVNLEDYQGWIELFGLQDEEVIFQKRILSIVSGAVLPIVALGFIKSLTDYLKPEKDETEYLLERPANKEHLEESLKQAEKIVEVKDKQLEKIEKVVEEARKETPTEVEDIKQKHLDRIKEKTPVPTLNEDIKNTKTPTDFVKPGEQQIDDGDVVYGKRDENIEVKVDEKTGTTYVKTKDKNKGAPGFHKNAPM